MWPWLKCWLLCPWENVYIRYRKPLKKGMLLYCEYHHVFRTIPQHVEKRWCRDES